jgi:hypothetical protein
MSKKKWSFNSGEDNSAVWFRRTGMVDVSINITFNYDIAALVSFPNQRYVRLGLVMP